MRKFRSNPAIATGSLALLAALALPAPASAAEHITLANGFDLVCHHHQLVDGKVRIYLKASQPDYFELSPQAIAGYETVPDPVPPLARPEGAGGLNPLNGTGKINGALAPDHEPTSQGFVKGHDSSRADQANGRNRALAPAGNFPSNPGHDLATERLTSEDLHQLLSKPSAEHNVDEDLLASVVKAESGGYPRAVSSAGALGLMQLMPGTARQLGVQDSFAPDQNVQGGAAYLDALLTRYRDNIALALAAYNAGPAAVDRYRGIPPYRETEAYVARVVHEFNRRVLARRRLAEQLALK